MILHRHRTRRARLERLVRTLIAQSYEGRVTWTATPALDDGPGGDYVATLDRYVVRITTRVDRWWLDIAVDGRLCCVANSRAWWLACSPVKGLVWALTSIGAELELADLMGVAARGEVAA